MRSGRSCRGLDRDGFMALGIKWISSGADPLHPLTDQDAVHLLEHRTQTVRARSVGLHPDRPLDAVDRVQPVPDHRRADLRNAALDLPRRALSVVVEVGQGTLVAILDPGELGGELAVVGLLLGQRPLLGRALGVTLV